MDKLHHILLVAKSLNDEHYLSVSDSFKSYFKTEYKISLLKVIPKVPFYYYQIPSTTNLQDDLRLDAEEQIRGIGRLLDTPHEDQLVCTGAFNPTVMSVAAELETDFVCVIGEKTTLPGTENVILHRVRSRSHSVCSAAA